MAGPQSPDTRSSEHDSQPKNASESTPSKNIGSRLREFMSKTSPRHLLSRQAAESKSSPLNTPPEGFVKFDDLSLEDQERTRRAISERALKTNRDVVTSRAQELKAQGLSDEEVARKVGLTAVEVGQIKPRI